MLAYALICLLTGWNIVPYGDGKFLHINYPFTNAAFLNIDNNLPYIIFSFSLPLLFYGFFFYLTGRIFKIFSLPKLFTVDNLNQLKKYYWLNLFVPLPALLLASFFVEIEFIVALLVLVHFVLGLFAWLLATLFSQGLKLQNEQDLFI
jgi:hypothetical protein